MSLLWQKQKLKQDFTHENANASNHTHCQVAQSQPHKPKLVKEYVCPNAEKRKENKARKHNKVYSAWLPIVSHDTIYRPLAVSLGATLTKADNQIIK